MVAPNINFSPEDFQRSENLQRSERIDPLTPENMFKGLIYVALSPLERYSTQARICSQLSIEGLDTPQAILSRPDELAYYVRGLKKAKYLTALARWWPTSQIHEMILEDIVNGRKDESKIRDIIVKQAKGLQYKCASLYMNMCGYKESVVLDTWALKLEVAQGYEIKSYYYNPKDGKAKNYKHTYLGVDKKGNHIYYDHGIPERDYKPLEANFIAIANKYGHHQYDFRQAFWAKNSTWNERARNDIHQLKLRLENVDTMQDKYMILNASAEQTLAPEWKEMQLKAYMQKLNSQKEKKANNGDVANQQLSLEI